MADTTVKETFVPPRSSNIAAATYEDYVVHQKPYDRALDLPDSFLQRTLASAIELGDAQKGQTLGVVKDLSFRPN
jgi:uncharacterized protein YrrD